MKKKYIYITHTVHVPFMGTLSMWYIITVNLLIDNINYGRLVRLYI